MTATILLVEDEPDVVLFVRKVLEREGGYRVETAPDGVRALELARTLGPGLDLLITDFSMPRMDGVDLCVALRAERSLEGLPIVMLTGHASTELKVRALEAGVDDFLAKPIGMVELMAKTRASLRTKALFDKLRADRSIAERQRNEATSTRDQLLEMLRHLCELRVPGAADRGARAERSARAVAERLRVSQSDADDVGCATRLAEVGRLVDATVPGTNPAADARLRLLSAAVLQSVGGLRGAGTVLAAAGEAWDGTGGPNRLRGNDIPITARIARAVLDFFAELDRSGPARAVAMIAARSGTTYDPLVVAQLVQLAQTQKAASWGAAGDRVPIDALVEGMTLGEDLVTSSGIKLAARGTKLTRGVLDLILRRHENEPLLHGAVVQRAAG
jgi:putative two-component system response regulator